MRDTPPSLSRALAVPLLLTLGLLVLLLRPPLSTAPSVRPPLPIPVALDELVPASEVVQVAEPGAAPPSPEGLRGWGAP